MLGIFFTPVLYVAVQRFKRKGKSGSTDASVDASDTGTLTRRTIG
jgi:hypothetical protein